MVAFCEALVHHEVGWLWCEVAGSWYVRAQRPSPPSSAQAIRYGRTSSSTLTQPSIHSSLENTRTPTSAHILAAGCEEGRVRGRRRCRWCARQPTLWLCHRPPRCGPLPLPPLPGGPGCGSAARREGGRRGGRGSRGGGGWRNITWTTAARGININIRAGVIFPAEPRRRRRWGRGWEHAACGPAAGCEPQGLSGRCAAAAA